MKVPRKDFEIFKKECIRLQKEWGLLGWELVFKFESLIDKKHMAETNANLSSRKATLFLSSELPDENKDDRDPIANARHEMLHVLLWRMSGNGYERFTTRAELEESEHEVIMQLLKIIP